MEHVMPPRAIHRTTECYGMLQNRKACEGRSGGAGGWVGRALTRAKNNAHN